MKLIPLSKGLAATVDDEDFDLVSKFTWHLQTFGHTPIKYAIRYYRNEKGQYRSQSMHRFLLGLTTRTQKGDHRDHDGLNNRRANLRIATHAQNMRNRLKRTKSRSRFKGVYWDESSYMKVRKWRAEIRLKGKRIRLGHFATEEEAAQAYKEAARKYHGEFACE